MTELDQHNFQYFRTRSIIPLVPAPFEERPAVLAARSFNFQQRFLADADTPLDAQVDDLPDLKNVQGDVIHLFPKKAEVFIFFRIADVAPFKVALQTFTPSSSADVIQFLYTIALEKKKAQGRKIAPIPQAFTQIAFSRMGMNFMDEREPTGDPRFDTHAMRDDKEFLGDQAQWDEVFNKPDPHPVHGSVDNDKGALHGVITIAGSDPDNAFQAAKTAEDHFGATIDVKAMIDGVARPGDWDGHEHFGYQDGISQPALRGLSKPWPGQTVVDPGVVVMGYKGDPVLDDAYAAVKRPAWAKDGTMMVFRKLQQFVPEFDDYLDRNGKRWREFAPGGEACKLTDQQGAELWGARMIGRWKSGAPVQKCPVFDDPVMAKDSARNNDFDYHIRDDPSISPEALTDFYCPFIAHTRKTAPRNLDPYIQRRFMDAAMIVRAGLPYGIEVTDQERDSKTSSEDADKQRGLLFVSYQSGLDQGFVRQTTVFGNNDFFPTTSLLPSRHGQDTVIGGPPVPKSASDYTEVQFVDTPSALPNTGQQVNWTLTSKQTGETISVAGFAGVKPADADDPPGVPQEFFVTSHGGEYFFVPSISTLKMWANDGKVGGLDVMFVVETSASMQKMVDQMRNNLGSICTNITQSCGLSSGDLRVGLVAFNDHPQGDSSTTIKSFEFQEDIAALTKSLATLEPYGAGDGPNAQSDALSNALNAKWREMAAKVVVLATSSSPHGIGEHGDEVPQGSPDYDPVRIANTMVDKGITLNVITCDPICSEHCPRAHDFYHGITKKTGGSVFALIGDSTLPSIASGCIVATYDIHRQAAVYRAYIRALAKRNLSFDAISKDICDKLTKDQVQLHKFEDSDLYASDAVSDENADVWFNAVQLDETTKNKIKGSATGIKQEYHGDGANSTVVALRQQAVSPDQADLIVKAALTSK